MFLNDVRVKYAYKDNIFANRLVCSFPNENLPTPFYICPFCRNSEEPNSNPNEDMLNPANFETQF